MSAEFFCAACRTPFLNDAPLDENGLCALCRNGLRGFDAVYSPGAYEGRLRQLIQLFKYGKVQTLAAPFGQWLSGALPRETAFDFAVPMPMHWRRRLQRGFNQADLLARALGRRVHLAVRPVIRRRRATPPQAGLSSSQRRANLAGAFLVTRPDLVSGARILLVDDVFTTGSSAAACARVLKQAGAKQVAVITLARADRRAGVEVFDRREAVEVSRDQSFGSFVDGKSGSIA